MPPAGGVKGGDPDQPVDAVLALQKAVGVLALDHNGGALDAGLVPVQIVHHPDLVAVPVGPHVVHPVEHGGPVLGLGAAGPGVEGQNGVVGIILPGEQGPQAGGLDLLRKGGELLLQLRQHGLVVLLQRHLAQSQQILPGGAELPVILALVLEDLQALLHLLGVGHVVPEALPLTGRLQLLDLLLGRVQPQSLPQNVQRGLVGVEAGLIFFKFQHVDPPCVS